MIVSQTAVPRESRASSSYRRIIGTAWPPAGGYAFQISALLATSKARR
jgi:hypothetical protein